MNDDDDDDDDDDDEEEEEEEEGEEEVAGRSAGFVGFAAVDGAVGVGFF